MEIKKKWNLIKLQSSKEKLFLFGSLEIVRIQKKKHKNERVKNNY